MSSSEVYVTFSFHRINDGKMEKYKHQFVVDDDMSFEQFHQKMQDNLTTMYDAIGYTSYDVSNIMLVVQHMM